MKKFRPLISHNIYNLPNKEEDIRKRTMQSFYKAEFCEDVESNAYECDIFKYKKLCEIKYSESLTDEAKVYLEKWISLRDDAKYLHFMLKCLQGFYSVIKINKGIALSTNQEVFTNFNPKRIRKEYENQTPSKRKASSVTPSISKHSITQSK